MSAAEGTLPRHSVFACQEAEPLVPASDFSWFQERLSSNRSQKSDGEDGSRPARSQGTSRKAPPYFLVANGLLMRILEVSYRLDVAAQQGPHLSSMSLPAKFPSLATRAADGCREGARYS